MKKEKGLLALMPLLVFIVTYLGSGIIAGDFYAVSVTIPFIISAIVAIIMNRSVSIEEKLTTFCKGAGNSNVIMMIVIFIFAGMFAEVAKTMGAVESTVNLGLTILPKGLIVAGIFIISCFIALSIGTSMGTIAALVPIALGVTESTGINAGLLLGALVGGAMFGDNLSMISDTTIAATRTQNCEMKDKFRVNFKIVLPAAILTTIIYTITSLGGSAQLSGNYDFDLIKILPYILVIVLALKGINVIVVLLSGLVSAALIGFAYGSFNIVSLFQTMGNGISGMSELIIVSLIIAGMVEIIKENGGIDYILNSIVKRINSKKGAYLGIGLLVSVVDVCTANNTIAIVTAGPIAKNISDKFNLDNRKVAGILDMFSCVFQGIIPYGAQLLLISQLSGIPSVAIIKYLFYPFIMGISALLYILFINKDK